MELISTFDPANPEAEAIHILQNLRQGSRSATDYIIDFKTTAADCGWNEQALTQVGLSDRIKDAMLAHEKPKTLQSKMDLVTRREGAMI